jgi:putative ABC transport system permease protein
VLGASDALLRQVMAAELLLAGALAGLLGAGGAMAAAWVLARKVFEFAWLPSPWWLPAGMLVGALLALLVGWLSLRRVLRVPPLRLLRAAD